MAKNGTRMACRAAITNMGTISPSSKCRPTATGASSETSRSTLIRILSRSGVMSRALNSSQRRAKTKRIKRLITYSVPSAIMNLNRSRTFSHRMSPMMKNLRLILSRVTSTQPLIAA